jgi:cytochrome P450
MHLARMELRIGLGAVLERLQGLRFDGTGSIGGAPPVRIEGMAFRSPPHLPVLYDSVLPGPSA